MSLVSIYMGSESDQDKMDAVEVILKEFGVEFNTYILSAHRCPTQLKEHVLKDVQDGVKVFIAGAGLSAALPGAIASHTALPVIGVPLYKEGGPLGGKDSLYSIVQMPKGVPVACVGINNTKNAAYLAVQILSLHKPELQTKLQELRIEKYGY